MNADSCHAPACRVTVIRMTEGDGRCSDETLSGGQDERFGESTRELARTAGFGFSGHTGSGGMNDMFTIQISKGKCL